MTKKEVNEAERIVPDSSVLIEGLVSRKIESKEIAPQLILIHEAALAELEHQANQNRAIGFLGLDELDRLRDLSEKHNFKIEFMGTKPRAVEIKYADLGEIDSLIRDLAFEQDAVLMTTDKIQARVAKAKGLRVLFYTPEQLVKTLKLEKFFDETTMSVHLRENVIPSAKKGMPGNWTFTYVAKKPMQQDEIQEISREIIEEASIRRNAFIEIERPGSTIVQLDKFRIVITKPPFSDGWEITAVRPVKKLSLEDYKLSEKLMKRIDLQAEGILIAGAPGMGKSTFAQGLAEHYANQQKIVKTVEAPRDLVLPDTITQYAISHGDAQEIHDILLLSRPDYTIFDEMRNTSDFKLFADLRLAGIGLAGVVHATNPIDAIQRFVGRIELGVIPQIIDTVVFIKNGRVDKVLNLKMTVKVPSGMTEADLARPVVVVEDFETGRLEYELYSYGEETVVIPVKAAGGGKSPTHGLAEKTIENELKKYTHDVKVELTSDHKCTIYVPDRDIAAIIGRQGKNIEQIEKKLGIGIDVQPLSESANSKISQNMIAYESQVTKKHVVFTVDKIFANKNASIFIDEDYLLSANIGKDGVVKISKKNKLGKVLVDALNGKENVRLVV